MLKYIRSFAVLFYLMIASLFGVITFLFSPFNANLVQPLGHLIGKVSLKILGIKLSLEDLELIEKNAPCVIVSNHQHNLDALLVSAMIPKRTVTIGKKSILYIPFFGQFFYLTGSILLDRSNRRKSFESMELAGKKIVEKSINVWILPEGTRSTEKGVLPFKKGAFHVAVASGRPILPVAISPYTAGLDLNAKNSSTVTMKVLPPIPTKGLTREDVSDVTDKAYLSIKNAVEEMENQS